MNILSLVPELMNFPKSWKVVPFDDAFNDATGGNAKIKQSDYLSNGSLPVIDQGKDFITGYVDDLSLRCQVKLPVILFGDHTKVLKFVDAPFVLGADGVKVLVPCPELDAKFGYYYLQLVRFPSDTGYSRHFKYLKSISVPLPPLDEQRRIAAILDKADAIRRKRQESIRLTEEFLRSTFLEMFGDIPAKKSKYDFGTIRGLVSAQSGKSSGPVLSSRDTGIPVYGGNGINGWATKALFDEKVVVVGRVGQQCGIVHITEGPAWVTDNAIVLKVTDAKKLHPIYVAEALQRSPLRKTVEQLDLPFINQSMVLDYPIPMPPLSDQVEFVKIRDALLKTQRNLGNGREVTLKLFSSLTHRAFRGEL